MVYVNGFFHADPHHVRHDVLLLRGAFLTRHSL
jgi:aarF domain-containing kinase